MTMNYLSPDRRRLWQSERIPSSCVLLYVSHKRKLYSYWASKSTQINKQKKPTKIFAHHGFIKLFYPVSVHWPLKKICIWSKSSNSDGPSISLPVLSYPFLTEYLKQWLLSYMATQVLCSASKCPNESPITTEVHRLSAKHWSSGSQEECAPFFGLQSFCKGAQQHPQHWDLYQEWSNNGRGISESQFPISSDKTLICISVYNLYISIVYNFSTVTKHCFTKKWF